MIDKFMAFAESKGLPLDQVDVLPDGQWHSFNDPEGSCSNSNARYILSDDPWSGAIGTHSGGWHCESWRPDGSSKLTSSEWEEIHQKQERRKSEQEIKYDQAAERASKHYGAGKQASLSHPYLVRKGVKPYGIKQHGEDILIPIYNLKQQIQTLQIINPDGKKKLFPGGKKQGGFHIVGDWTSNLKLYVAEGWATAATVHEITGEPCACAVDCGNLEPAIAALKEWLSPSWEFCIAADNDWETTGNPGLTKALQTALKHQTDLWCPPFTEADKGLSDWNDWHMKHNKRTNND